MDAAVTRIKNNKHSVWIFPEGTRNSRTDDFLPFKKGAFHVSIESGAPIIPVVIGPLSSIADLKNKRVVGGEFTIRILPPVYTTHLTKGDLDTLVDKVRNDMLVAFQDICKKSAQRNNIKTQ